MVARLRHILLLTIIQALGVLAQQPVWRLTTGTIGNNAAAITVFQGCPDTVFAQGYRKFVKSVNRGESWDSISNVTNAQSALLVHSTDQKLLLCFVPGGSSSSSDLIRSTDGGNTWYVVLEGFDFPTAVFQQDPIWAEVVYAGLGPKWVLKSTNFGETWDTLSIPNPGLFLTSLAVVATVPRTIYVGTLNTVLKSTDDGSTWLNVTPPGLGGFFQGTLLAADRFSDDVYVGIYSQGSNRGGMYKSTNAGGDWSEINDGLTNNYWQVKTLLMNPKHPNELFLGVMGQQHSLFRTTNGGLNWEAFDQGLPLIGSPSWVFSLAIDTLNNRVYAGAGSQEPSDTTGIFVADLITSAPSETSSSQVECFQLEQNFPNPFNPSTELRVSLVQSRNITLLVHDILGREVATLARGFYLAGSHTFTWNAEGFASGIYIARITLTDNAGRMKFTSSRKMLLLR